LEHQWKLRNGVRLGNKSKLNQSSTSASKEALAKEKGADFFCVSTDPDSMKANANKCDIILNTVSANHEAMTYMPLLRPCGTLV
jgi:uncharacterized zinc-type alcohol dehydrogenase-like protein